VEWFNPDQIILTVADKAHMKSAVRIHSPEEIKLYARSYAPFCINVLRGIAASRKSPAAARAVACRELLDRGYGKAIQSSTEEVNITVRHVVTGVDRPGDDALLIEADVAPALPAAQEPETNT
jgi:hypothetical protein